MVDTCAPLRLNYGVQKFSVMIFQQAMEQLVEKGLCKAIGISNFTTKKINSLLETAKIIPACNQGVSTVV